MFQKKKNERIHTDAPTPVDVANKNNGHIGPDVL